MRSNLHHYAAAAVLCAFVTVNVIVSGAWAQQQRSQCATGSCVSIYECPTLLSLLQSRFLTSSIVNRLRRAQCIPPFGLTQSTSFVCCENNSGSQQMPRSSPTYESSRPVQKSSPSQGEGNQLPSSLECGVESTTRKILGGVDVELNEFPWMAVLEYERLDGSWTLECGGFLINKRYVVTAAHCVTGKQVSDVGRLVNVRLGEYNTETAEDCVQLENAKDCADPVQNFGVEEIVIHEGYLSTDISSTRRGNDIALLRLSGNAKYSEFVAPICLPSDTFPGTGPNKKLLVAGWGRTLVSKRSSIKQKVSVPSYDFEACRQMYAARNVDLDETQLCAGGDYAQDSCSGDSGGPLMSRENDAWIAEGIVSFGLGCGAERPAVYTKVQAFLPWIRSKLRA